MRKLLPALVLSLLVPTSAFALPLYFTPPDPNIDNLDHHYIYVWRLDDLIGAGANQIPVGNVILSAKLYFKDIRNWDNGANRLFAHLLDDAKYLTNECTPSLGNGCLYDDDDTTKNNRITWARDSKDSTSGDIYDDLASGATAYSDAAKALVTEDVLKNRNNALGGKNDGSYTKNGGTSGWIQGKNAVDAGKSGTHSFMNDDESYEYIFSAAEIADLNAWIFDGSEDIAFALDPDCHFDNTKIQFILEFGAQQVAVPEPASMLLLGTGLAGLVARRYRRSRQ